MESWQSKLPSNIIDALQLPPEELNDFAGPVTRLDILSRITFQRALRHVAREQEAIDSESGWGDEDGDGEDIPTADDALKITIAAHKELVRAKYLRLEAKDKFKEAADRPERLDINFNVTLPSAKEAVERFINMGDYKKAREVAQLHRIESEFDWGAVTAK